MSDFSGCNAQSSDQHDMSENDTPVRIISADGDLPATDAADDDVLVHELEEAFDMGFSCGTLDVEATPLTGADLDNDPFVRARRAERARTSGAVAAPCILEDAIPMSSDGNVRESVSTNDADADLVESIMDSTPVWTGSFLTGESVTVRLPNGRTAQRDVVRHPGAVAIIALTDDGKMVLVHQYRTALEQVTLEIPAGKLEPGEDPLEAASRELVEETGYLASRMAYLGPMAPAAGYSDEILHLYMAMGLTFVGAQPDADEFLHVDLVDVSQMVDRVLDGKIIDSKTMAAVLICDAIGRRMQ